MNANAMRQSHQAKLVQLISLLAFSCFLNSLSFACFLHNTCLVTVSSTYGEPLMNFTTTLRSTPMDRENAYRTRGTANDRQDAHLLW